MSEEGGQTFNPPGHVRQADITWLSKMQLLVDLDAIALRPGGFAEAPRSSSGALRATPGSPTSEDEAPGTPSVPSVPATPATLDSVPPTPEPPRAEPKVEPKAEPRAEPRPKAEPALKVEPAPVAPVAVEPKAEAKARPREEPVTASKSVTLQPEPEVQARGYEKGLNQIHYETDHQGLILYTSFTYSFWTFKMNRRAKP